MRLLEAGRAIAARWSFDCDVCRRDGLRHTLTVRAPTHVGSTVIPADVQGTDMASSSKRKAVVACTDCGSILGAERREDGSFTPLGTEDECACGESTFRRLR